MTNVLPTDPAERKGIPVMSGVLDYFPAALAEVARVSKAGNDQHNPGQPLHWARGKSTDQADTLLRHLMERGTVDSDGMRHSAKVAWRALALLQTELEEEGLAPLARGARLPEDDDPIATDAEIDAIRKTFGPRAGSGQISGKVGPPWPQNAAEQDASLALTRFHESVAKLPPTTSEYDLEAESPRRLATEGVGMTQPKFEHDPPAIPADSMVEGLGTFRYDPSCLHCRLIRYHTEHEYGDGTTG